MLGRENKLRLVVAASVAFVGCSPQAEAPVTTLNADDLAESAEAVALVDPAPDSEEPVFRPGLFAAFFNGSEGPATDAAKTRDGPIQVALTDGTLGDAVDPAVAGADGAPVQATVDPAPTAVEVPARRGLFAGLFGHAGAVDGDISGAEAAEAAGAGQESPPNTILRAAGRSSEPDVAPGAPQAFGTVGRVCDLSRRSRGKEVERFPARGRGGYRLYDSAPGSTAPRAFYITGFSDGCARQVTAANVIFGAPSMHERLRYGLPAGTPPSSRTDEAYKTLKSRVCGVPRSAPCGAPIARLERNTVFVTMYDSFTGNQTWSNLLLHDGAVLASDHKGQR